MFYSQQLEMTQSQRYHNWPKFSKNKFHKPSALELIQAPVKAAENKQPSALVQPILTSPMKYNYQTRSPITESQERRGNHFCKTPSAAFKCSMKYCLVRRVHATVAMMMMIWMKLWMTGPMESLIFHGVKRSRS
jgi:hypothetical protein